VFPGICAWSTEMSNGGDWGSVTIGYQQIPRYLFEFLKKRLFIVKLKWMIMRIDNAGDLIAFEKKMDAKDAITLMRIGDFWWSGEPCLWTSVERHVLVTLIVESCESQVCWALGLCMTLPCSQTLGPCGGSARW